MTSPSLAFYNRLDMKIGMFGLGFMGCTHLRALGKIPGVELVTVVSDDERALGGDMSHIAGNFGGPGERYDFSRVSRHKDVDAGVADSAADAVDLCLPTSLHAPTAIACLKAGKHVLVEKPMAMNAGECEAMMAAARESGKILMTAQVLRFFPAYTVLRDVLRSGRIGKTRSAIFRRRCAAPAWSVWMGNKAISGGGVFDLLIHDVDMCLHLFGPPKAISATGCEDLEAGIDTLAAELHYDDIPSVVVTGGWHHKKAYPFSMEYTVVAEGGTVEYSSEGRPPALYRADGDKEEIPLPETDGYQAEIEYFVECCRTGRQPEICPPRESAAAVKLMRMLEEARNEKGAKISCQL